MVSIEFASIILQAHLSHTHQIARAYAYFSYHDTDSIELAHPSLVHHQSFWNYHYLQTFSNNQRFIIIYELKFLNRI